MTFLLKFSGNHEKIHCQPKQHIIRRSLIYLKYLGGAHSITHEMEWVVWVQNLDEAVYVSLCANVVSKGMSPSLFLPVMGK